MRGVIVVVLLAACGPNHVNVPPLPPNLTPDQRIATFQQWRKRGHEVERTGSCRGLVHGCNTDIEHTLVLAGGVSVTEGDDLIPLLHPASEAGKAAARISRRRTHQNFWGWFAVGSIVTGVIVAGIGTRVEPDAKVPVLGIVGAGIAGLGFTGGYVARRYHTKRIQRESATVFTHYDQGLSQQLGICVSGMVLVPCEGR